ncbi:GNAT family N-acetyltransferase [Planosporangium thailandense]|uniref:GNAT family N-acetyltransferase n=1 Tax=Planosporangium thailandense TaxID=765197 RepID=A0ABX0XQY5_9ACTN|nr:GNAT family N-acetyltransferase [Planosporangium thailandense]NJC68231.1 GNAT family N-acetyltransferase [Planosporangium thailandense]
MLTAPVRLLGDTDRASVERLLDLEPYTGAQVAERIAAAGLSRRRQDARIFGYGSRGHLESLCWLGANLIPVRAGSAAVAAFADLIGSETRICSSIVGDATAVLPLWERLRPVWGRARDVRECQPLLAAETAPMVAADPAVRLVRPNEVGLLYPASVAMYTEEVGVSPVVDGDTGYRDRVADLVRGGRAYARFIDGQVAFKAELAVITRHTAQVQGVWTAPQWRGCGLATAGMAAVVADALRRVAPTVTLYVNDFNAPARRVYARCGFRRVGTFATVLF